VPACQCPQQASAEDLAKAQYSLNSACGSDGLSLGWRPDGGGLAVSGQRAAVFDFTGANAPHPYRINVHKSGQPILAGQPDPVPRLCMADGAESVAWAPCAAADAAATRLASVTAQGVVRVWPAPNRPRSCHEPAWEASLSSLPAVQCAQVRVWQPHQPPLRKGGNGNPSQPERMKPQVSRTDSNSRSRKQTLKTRGVWLLSPA